jgi:hypothetical protein
MIKKSSGVASLLASILLLLTVCVVAVLLLSGIFPALKNGYTVAVFGIWFFGLFIIGIPIVVISLRQGSLSEFGVTDATSHTFYFVDKKSNSHSFRAKSAHRIRPTVVRLKTGILSSYTVNFTSTQDEESVLSLFVKGNELEKSESKGVTYRNQSSFRPTNEC